MQIAFPMVGISPVFASYAGGDTIRRMVGRYVNLRVGDTVRVTHLEAAYAKDATSMETLTVASLQVSSLRQLVTQRITDNAGEMTSSFSDSWEQGEIERILGFYPGADVDTDLFILVRFA